MPAKKAKFGKVFYLLIAVQAFTSAAFYTVAPILTKYLVGSGMTVALAGTVSGMISLTALVVRPFSGVLADKISPKLILLFTIPLLALSTWGYTLSTATASVFFFRILNGVAFCLNGTTIIAFSCRFIPEERMSEGIGYQGLGNVLASAICPGIGISISRNYGYKVAFMAGAALALIGLLLLIPIKEEHITPRLAAKGERSGFRFNDMIAVSVLPMAFLAGLFSFTNGTVTNFMVLVTEENGLTEISMYYTVIAIAMVVLRPFAGRLCDKYGIGMILVPAYILTFLGTQLISHTTSAVTIAAVGILMAFGQGGGSPALLGEAIKTVDPKQRGAATGTYYIFLDVFQGISPMIGGALVTAFGTYKAPFALAGLFLGMGLLLFFLFGKKVFGKTRAKL